MRLRLLGSLVGLAALLAVPAAAAPRSGQVTQGSYTEPGGVTRSYLLYTPAHLPKRAPLVMFLHGCNETAQEAMQASHWNTEADRYGFAVVYPSQAIVTDGVAPVSDGNGLGCWNWFVPQDQERGGPEPAVLAGMARALAQQLGSDVQRVYVEGVSAGADMSVILAASYPDVFAAAGSIAGCSYRTCTDETGALAYQQMGPRARVVPMLVENGTADVLNPAPQSTDLVESWLGVDDLADDGAPNGSVSRQPATSSTSTDTGTPTPGGGDACIHNNSFGCLGGALGLSAYPVTVQTYAVGSDPDSVELWLVHGMAHAHPDAPGDGPYTDPLGPDITAASWAFFSRHSL